MSQWTLEYSHPVYYQNITSSLYGILDSAELFVSSINQTSTLSELFQTFMERPPIQNASVQWSISSLQVDSTILQSTCDSHLSSLSSAYFQIPLKFTGSFDQILPSQMILRSSMQTSTLSLNQKIHIHKQPATPVYSTMTDVVILQMPVFQ